MTQSNNQSVGGSRPISYVENGKQIFIPLGFISLVNGMASINAAALDAANISVINITDLEGWVNDLLGSGELVQAEALPRQPAFAVRAKRPGAAGNLISVSVKLNPVSNGSPESFDFTVRLTEIIDNLEINELDTMGASNPNFLETKIASSELITVEEPAGGYAFPKAYPGTAGDGSDLVQFSGGDSTTASFGLAEQPSSTGGGAAFTIKAKESGAQGDNITVAIRVDSPSIFSMTVIMTETFPGAEIDEKLPDGADNPKFIDTLLSSSYLVEFIKSGDAIQIPSDGIYSLFGGKSAFAASTLIIG